MALQRSGYHPLTMSMDSPCQWILPLQKKKHGPLGQWTSPSIFSSLPNLTLGAQSLDHCIVRS